MKKEWKIFLIILGIIVVLVIIILVIYRYGKTWIEPIDILGDVVLTTDKTEYNKGEEVKVTVKNNLDDNVEVFSINVEPSSDEGQIENIYLAYLEAGKSCDIDKAMSIITEKSKEIIHYTCSNIKNETKCYLDMNYEIRIKGDNAVLYLTPFDHKKETPLFFSKENGEWKLNFYKMWAGLVMAGSTCNSGWGWRNQELADEFCDYFEEGQCPDK